MTAAMDAAQPIPEQPTVVVPAPVTAMPYFTGFGTALLLADTTAMQIPIGALWPSGHAKAKHGLDEVARIHKAFMALPAAYVAKYKTPCPDRLVRIPVPMDNGEYGLEVLRPIADGLYQEVTAFIPWRGWDYISDVLNDCRGGPGSMAGAQ
jgi:hypothetical protein